MAHILTVTPAVYDAVIDHAVEEAPREACGILGGERGEEQSEAVMVRRAENVATSPQSRYRIDPAEQFELMDEIESAGQDIVGFYHSHPAGPSGPSATDAARANWPGYSYLIVVQSGTYPYVGSWRWNGKQFERELLALQ